MGRGRAKAKQTKVARKLKYTTGNTDLAQLAEELGASSGNSADDTDRRDGPDEYDEVASKYADYADDPPRQ